MICAGLLNPAVIDPSLARALKTVQNHHQRTLLHPVQWYYYDFLIATFFHLPEAHHVS